MLTIHAITSAADAKKYYSVADYYSEGQETVGQWGGKLASVLGLSGQVDKASFDRLCDNIDPRPDELGNYQRLTQRTVENRRVGYDFMFSAPKSFSIVEALGSEAERRALLKAFDDSVRETMELDVEPDMLCRVRKAGQEFDRNTGAMVWAEFDHSTARPVDDRTLPDMQRHKHVVAFNATYDPVEREIKAGQFGNLKRDGEYYTACFYSRLAGRLEAMGYAIDRQGGKAWEIAGVTRPMIDKFSKRTGQVEAEAERRNITSVERKAELGALTRGKKQKELTPQELREAWDAQLSDDDRDALAKVYGREIVAAEPVTAVEAVRFAIDHVSEKLSVAPEREFRRLALLRGLGCVDAAAIEAELPRQGLIAAEIDGRVMATTAALQAEEDVIAGFAANGRGNTEPVGVAAGLTRTLEGGKTLNDGQWQAVAGLLESPNRVNLVEGPAGAGKSSMLAKFDEGLTLAGQKLVPLATTAAAAEVLEKDGFADAKTLSHFLLDEKLQKQAAGGWVLVDESSMLGHRDAVRLYTLADKLNLRLVHVGDPMQHGSVPRGSFLHVLKEYGHIKPFKLTQILRQETPEYRSAAELLSEGKTAEGFAAIDSLGWVKEISGDERYRQMAAEYVAAWQELKRFKENERVLVVSPTHAEAARITGEIRSQLRAAGKLGEDEGGILRLVPVDASEAERRLATTYRPGDVIQFHQNAKGFTKGERLTVTDPAAVPLEHAGKFSLYRPEKLSLAVGDRVRFTGTVKTLDGKHTLRNGKAHTVAGFTAKGIRLDNGWLVGKDAGHLRHGFVETSFGSQGRTVRRVILGMASQSLPATNAEQMYVSASRAKESLSMYTDDKAAVASAIERTSRKLAALDLKPKKPVELTSERMRLHQLKRRKQAFFDRMRSAWPGSRPKQPTPPTPGHHADRLKPRERNLGYGR